MISYKEDVGKSIEIRSINDRDMDTTDTLMAYSTKNSIHYACSEKFTVRSHQGGTYENTSLFPPKVFL